MPEKFDVIVVGAGLSGLAAAYTMATQGLSVAVIERGAQPGSKNVMGGVMYRQPMVDVFPEFCVEAPVERPVVEKNLWVLSADSAIKGGHRSAAWAQEPYNAFTVQRAVMDRWLAEKARAVGALIIPATTVVELLKDGRGRAIGVRTNRPQGDLLANIVILAEGAVSFLAERHGLHRKWKPEQLALAVKATLAPPGEGAERARVIEGRFGLPVGQGATIEIFGTLLKGMVGTAFLNTNRETLSFGVAALLADFGTFQQNPHALLQEVQGHAALQPYLADCTTVEYAAHLIPAGGYDAIPQLYADGVLVVGDAAQLSNSLYREGANLAVTSGKLAGEVAVAAHAQGDFTVTTLRAYEERLSASYVIKDLKQTRRALKHAEKHRHLLVDYPGLLNRMATEYFSIDSVCKAEKQGRLWRMLGNKARVLTDLWGLFKVVK